MLLRCNVVRAVAVVWCILAARLRSVEDLRQVLSASGFDVGRFIDIVRRDANSMSGSSNSNSEGAEEVGGAITSCGSGITAALVNFALFHVAGQHPAAFKHMKLYDGSWAEWGSSKQTRIETGPAK